VRGSATSVSDWLAKRCWRTPTDRAKFVPATNIWLSPGVWARHSSTEHRRRDPCPVPLRPPPNHGSASDTDTERRELRLARPTTSNANDARARRAPLSLALAYHLDKGGRTDRSSGTQHRNPANNGERWVVSGGQPGPSLCLLRLRRRHPAARILRAQPCVMLSARMCK
jgi:hypothetical protein